MKKIKNIITMVVLAAVVISMIWFYQVCINIPVGNINLKKRIVLSWKILNTQIGAYVLRINTEKNILR